MTRKPITAPTSIGRHLAFTAGVSHAVTTKFLEPHGLTLAQWAVLSSLWRNGEMSVKELAQLTGNASPATSRIVDRMVTGGLLNRIADPNDRRAVVVGLSEKAEALRPLRSIYEQVNAVLLADLTDAEKAQLFDLLQRVEQSGRDWMETGADGPGSPAGGTAPD